MWPDSTDVNKEIIATASKIQRWTKDVWVNFYFSESGIEHLQRIVDGQPNYGWLIKYEDETTANVMTFFHSSEAENKEDRPYLLILYTKADFGR